MSVINENKNIKAFLDMIAFSEGTKDKGDDGYNIIVGYSTFSDYSKHPNKSIFISKSIGSSTAAGRYQILFRFWNAYKDKLSLKDFSPLSQDLYAVNQLRETGAYNYIIKGQVSTAISKCSSRWASLPGAGYNQREHKLDTLIKQYVSYGGQLEED